MRYVERGAIPTDLLQEMSERFRPDVQQLSILLERDLGAWGSPNKSVVEASSENAV